MTPFWNLVRDLLASFGGSFAIIFSFLILCGWCIHIITKMNTQWQERKAGVDKLEDKIDKISKDLLVVKAAIEVIQTVPPDKRLTKSHSPVSLTPLGQEVATRMKLQERISSNWTKIQDFIDASAIDKNAYDIQQLCIETATIYPEKFLKQEDLKAVKMFAFNEGRPYASYAGVIGVMIRDEYFRIKGIPIEEVDENDPRIKPTTSV